MGFEYECKIEVDDTNQFIEDCIAKLGSTIRIVKVDGAVLKFYFKNNQDHEWGHDGILKVETHRIYLLLHSWESVQGESMLKSLSEVCDEPFNEL